MYILINKDFIAGSRQINFFQAHDTFPFMNRFSITSGILSSVPKILCGSAKRAAYVFLRRCFTRTRENRGAEARLISCFYFLIIPKEFKKLGREKKIWKYQWHNVSIPARIAAFSISFYPIIIRYRSRPSPSIRPRNHLLPHRAMKNSFLSTAARVNR